VAHGGMSLVYQHLISAPVEEPGDGRVYVRGEHPPAALPLLGARLDVGRPSNPSRALHVCGNQHPHPRKPAWPAIATSRGPQVRKRVVPVRRLEQVLGLPDRVRGCLFDLDGVLTKTALVHDAAWKAMFDDFLHARAERTGQPFVPFDPVRDYDEYVDGRPRA